MPKVALIDRVRLQFVAMERFDAYDVSDVFRCSVVASRTTLNHMRLLKEIHIVGWRRISEKAVRWTAQYRFGQGKDVPIPDIKKKSGKAVSAKVVIVPKSTGISLFEQLSAVHRAP